jgi:SanA protein
MNKTLKIAMWIISMLAVICIATMMICYHIVSNNAKGKVFYEISSIQPHKVGLLLGTTPQSRYNHNTNYFFIYRIDAAEQLFKAGKIEQILISGDENSLDGINEPECMRDSLLARGIPTDAIILDGKGYRTICSVINAYQVYGFDSFVVISQRFHNERALYQAEHLGLNVKDLQAFNARDPKSKRALITYIREYLARVKMFLDLIEKAPEHHLSRRAVTPTL